MTGISLIFGGCVVSIPNGGVALAMILYFFGIGSPAMTPLAYHEALMHEYQASGLSQPEAVASIKRFDRCARDYVVPRRDRNFGGDR